MPPNLLDEGNNSSRKVRLKSYLLYAMGEIILVVVGILIAISINNWKKNADLKAQEQGIYADIKLEIQTDLTNIRSNRNYNAKYLSRYNRASEIILSDTKKEFIDTLAIIATELTNFSDFKNENSPYEMLATSGKINLLSNKDILRQLKNLGVLYTYINRLEQNQEAFMYTVVPKISNYLRFNPLQVIHQEKLYDYQFQNDIEIFIKIGIEKDGLYKQAEQNINQLINSLESEIN